MLPDSAQLAKIFYTNGTEVLRQASSKLGGYAQLDRLSRSIAGRKRIQAAIKNHSADELVRTLLAEQSKKAAELPKRGKKQASRARSTKIYTVADFLAALDLAALESSQPSEPSPEIQPETSGERPDH